MNYWAGIYTCAVVDRAIIPAQKDPGVGLTESKINYSAGDVEK